MSSRRPPPNRSTRSRAPARRGRRRGPIQPTEWGHVVAAILLTLLALGSWVYAARDVPEATAQGTDGGSEGPREEDAPLRSFSMAASGDILIHEPVAARAASNGGGDYDFDPMFASVQPLISDVDLGICHMETPISKDNSDISSFPIFNAPRQIADALKNAGFDLCSTASNHSFDKGSEGVRNTLKVLKRSGLRTEGTATGETEAKLPELVDVNGVKVGHLSYTYGLNGFVLPSGEEYLVDVLKVKRILRAAERAKEMGAEFVVVSLHWGLEFQSEPTEEQLKGARRLLRSDAVDLIFGHHAHVPQAIKRVGDEFVIFGLGNFLSNQRPGATATCCLPQTQDGLLVRVDVQETEDGWDQSVSYWPTWVRPETYEILPVAAALNDPAHSDIASSLNESWDRTVATVNSLGARKAGVRPAERP